MSRRNVSLWTPYVDDVPLDLTKSAVDVQSTASYTPRPPLVPLPAYLPVPYGTYCGAPQPGGSSSGCPVLRHCAAHLVLSPPASLSPPGAPEHRPDITDAGALSDDPDFQEFERRGLEVLAAKNGGALVGDNPRMRRSVHTSSAAAAADAAYRSQRERNNRAAKQSRDRRKLREIHLSLKAAYLERKVVALQAALNKKVCARCNRPCSVSL